MKNTETNPGQERLATSLRDLTDDMSCWADTLRSSECPSDKEAAKKLDDATRSLLLSLVIVRLKACPKGSTP